ncbi:hypothetical protein P620_00525 [Lactococcus lactis subsp. lactis KLDS 4.0325]|nr:hypothetical protein P620_00525 [Lactococcus lactis subsp. lactis KLDS 4.0325]
MHNFQNFADDYQCWLDNKIYLGKGTWLTLNVGIIINNHGKHLPGKEVVIGENCCIGMNTVFSQE